MEPTQYTGKDKHMLQEGNLTERASELGIKPESEPKKCSWIKWEQKIFDCAADLYLTNKPREEIADNIVKYLAELDKCEAVAE